MRKFIFYPLLSVISLLVLIILTAAAVLFFRPSLVINPKNLNWALEKTDILKSWSWEEAEMDFGWKKWNQRLLSGHFKDFCFHYEAEDLDAKSCLDHISWNMELLFSFSEGLEVRSIVPVEVTSDKLLVTLKEGSAPEMDKEASDPPDIWGIWQILWKPYLPDLHVQIAEIEIARPEEESLKFDLELLKQDDELTASVLDFNLHAGPSEFRITAPPEYPLPVELVEGSPLRLFNFSLQGEMSSSDIPLTAKGSVEALDFIVNANVDLPLEEDPGSVEFRKKFLETASGRVELNNVKEAMGVYGPDKYKTLPAPFNVMNGNIVSEITTESLPGDSILVKAETNFDMQSEKQVLDFMISTDVPLNLESFSPGSIVIGMNFNEVTIQLPRLSKTSAPPQLMPDGRIKDGPLLPQAQEEEKEDGADLTMHLQALEENEVQFRSNLLDEPLRLNFDLLIDEGDLKQGFIRVLPLETTLFKRPIEVQNIFIKFDAPLDPVIEGEILFPLPEYKITLKLEGPINQPRFALSSEPPLPEDDILAVLLFGRPLSEMEGDDREAAQQTNQILSRGILSLSALYFLAGSPVEYVGYDPESETATAQVGLGSRSSVRVGGGSEGVRSTGLRHSLGGGWFIDTSVQTSRALSETDDRNYGVMLERIISY